MTWAPLLLADRSPSLRYLVLRDLLGNRDEASELEALRDVDPLVKTLVGLQNGDGSWGRGSIAGNAPAGNIQITAQALTRLGYLGYGPDYQPVGRGAEYLFTQQLDDGSWPLDNVAADIDGGQVYDVMSLQTSLPLRGLAECGYAEDQRAERAYDWNEAEAGRRGVAHRQGRRGLRLRGRIQAPSPQPLGVPKQYHQRTCMPQPPPHPTQKPGGGEGAGPPAGQGDQGEAPHGLRRRQDHRRRGEHRVLNLLCEVRCGPDTRPLQQGGGHCGGPAGR